LNLDRREFAVLCVLMLRGFQTTGELRERTHRLYTFDDLAAVESCLNRMIERSPALAVKLARSAGSKEPRYAHLFSGTPQVVENEAVPSALPAGAAQSYGERIIALEAEVTVLKQEVASLRTQLAEFRGQFE
ncbi:MAG: DUF480 domain-containing protein, partial [Acidobacteria bacterium]|nr:DUF480 domain-containing protein [Acidobacteriota bacterium]